MVTIINEDKLFPASNTLSAEELDRCSCEEAMYEIEMDRQTATKIFHKYHSAFDGDVQGACIVIADEIRKAIGGDCVAGYLCMCGIERSHWWVEKDGRVYDPMGDMYKNEIGFHRREAHRNREEFNAVLPKYERYRL